MNVLNMLGAPRRSCLRGILVAFGLMALAPAASRAQVVVGGPGDGAGPLTCAANVGNPMQARAEGHSELLGDITIICVGGVMPAAGSAIPTVDITVSLAAMVTSKTFGGGVSEALLL